MRMWEICCHLELTCLARQTSDKSMIDMTTLTGIGGSLSAVTRCVPLSIASISSVSWYCLWKYHRDLGFRAAGFGALLEFTPSHESSEVSFCRKRRLLWVNPIMKRWKTHQFFPDVLWQWLGVKFDQLSWVVPQGVQTEGGLLWSTKNRVIEPKAARQFFLLLV